MRRLLAVAFVTFSVALAAEEKPVTKNSTARGYYGTASDMPAYPQEPVQTQPIYYPVYPPPPRLEDRNVCDLDAGILLVTNHRRHHGQYKAIRVRCSEIASYDEDSCNVCCQNAARRDRNLPNSAMFGFLAAVDDHKKDKDSKSKERNSKSKERDERHNSPEEMDGDDARRKKRSAEHFNDKFEVEKTYLKADNWSPDPHYRNLRCVCCAPKRPLPVFPIPYQYQPQTGYQPPVQSPPQGYQAPAQSPPQYQPPVQSPPQGYQPPAQSPPQGYQPPAQSPPQGYQPPAQSPPQGYQPPAQSPPQYQPPVQSPPQGYQPPAQSPPQYQPPAQSPPQGYQPPAANPPGFQPPQQTPTSY